MASSSAVVGRGDLIDAVRERLAGPDAAGVVLIGQAGIGKTTVWTEYVARAAAAGWRVLVARCAATEAALPWVGLTDLLAGFDFAGSDFAGLPAPQRDALEVATLRAYPAAAAPDDRAVGMALLSVLTALTAESTVLLAIDDLDHLDPASAKSLEFALRRLDPSARVRAIATARTAVRSPLDVLASGVIEIDVRPLPVAALFRLLHDRLGLVFDRPTLTRIHHTAAGNPLYALELARALDRLEVRPVTGAPLGVPGTLRELVAERIGRLDPPARTIVAATAATPRLATDGLDPRALATAVRESLVDVEADLVTAAHPLLAAAAYASLSTVERLALHDWLVSRSADPIERGRHLALATTGPDPAVADALDAATVTACARGAIDAAAELSGLAVERTPESDPCRAERLHRWADLLFKAGDVAGAERAQSQAIRSSPAGAARARQRVRLAEIVVEARGWNASLPVLEEALVEAGGDALLAAEVHLTLAAVMYDDMHRAAEHAERAVSLVESVPDPDPGILVGTLVQAAGAAFRAGHGLDHERFHRAMELERVHPTRRLSDRADAGYAALLKYADDLDGAQRLFDSLRAEAAVSGDVSSEGYVLGHLPQLALWRGDLALARTLAEEHLALTDSAGLTAQRASAVWLVGLVAVHDGHDESGERLLRAQLERAEAGAVLWEQQRLHGVLGLLFSARGDVDQALAHLDAWHRIVGSIGLAEPGYARHHLEYCEGLAARGRLDDLSSFVDGLADQAIRTGRPYAHATVAAGRALLASARGDADGARTAIETALRLHDGLPLRFQRARCLLVAGHVYRRVRAKLAARDTLVQARDEFRAMGAPLWTQRAVAELERVNIRPPAPTTLTETERRVAELAARGLTNRQVADALFMGTKTVEANVARIYRKLGISSRAELGARFGPDAVQAG